MQTTVYNAKGEQGESIELDDFIFGIEPNTSVMHQALVRQHANARLGTHDTKTRGEVSGGNSKPWRQKGTGRARQGSTRSPQWRHGGVVFGPHPRSYHKDMPRKMRRLAIRSALSHKAAEGQIVVLGALDGLEPKTKSMVEMLKAIGANDQKVLILIPNREGDNQIIFRGAANLDKTLVLNAAYLNIRDLLRCDRLIIPTNALETINHIWGEDNERHAPGYYARRRVAAARGEEFVGMAEARRQAVQAMLDAMTDLVDPESEAE